MKRFYLSSLIMLGTLFATLSLTNSEQAKLGLVEKLHDVGYYNDADYEAHASRIDPARKFFKSVREGGFGARAVSGARFVRVGE